mgnify:CR=1 FL=1
MKDMIGAKYDLVSCGEDVDGLVSMPKAFMYIIHM